MFKIRLIPKYLQQILQSQKSVIPKISVQCSVMPVQFYSTGTPKYAANTFPNNTPAINAEQINPFDSPENLHKKRQVLELELSVLRQEGRKAPDPNSLKPHHWDHLLSLMTKSARRKYYTFLWQVEKKKENEQIKKEERKHEMDERRIILKKENAQNEHIIYGLNHNTFLLRVYDSTINHWHNNKLSRAMQFGQQIVLDCSYDQHMTEREAINAAKQLMLLFSENRLHSDPFDLHFCNANFNGATMKYLQKHIPTMLEPWFPLNVHKESYLQHFPKERLVYLTPHCRNDLTEYNPDDVYIVGAMVDRMNNEPLSLGKAKKEGLRMARLPLDEHLLWGAGSGKSLTLNQMTRILLDLKTTGKWADALQHVPRRKLVNEFNDKRDNRYERKRNWNFDLDSWGDNKPNQHKNQFRKKF